MTPDGISIRAVKLDDLDAIAEIYSTLWCNTLRNRGDLEDAKLASRFNIVLASVNTTSDVSTNSIPRFNAAVFP